MNKRSIIINSLAPNGDKLQKTLTDVNPAATATQITTFTRALNGLTNNSYASTQSIDRDVVMSTATDTKIPPCYIRNRTAWYDYENLLNFEDDPKTLSGTTMSLSDFNEKIVGGGAIFCTASDATPYVSKLPDDATLVLTDVTDWIRAKTANMTNYLGEETTVAALSTDAHVNAWYKYLVSEEGADLSTDQGAILKQEACNALFGWRFWKINRIAINGSKHGGEYIISLPATAKYSATNFSFTVIPEE